MNKSLIGAIAIIILVSVVLVSGCTISVNSTPNSNLTNNPKFEILDNNLTVMKNSTNQEKGYNFINATIKNVGNSTIQIVGVEVHFGDKPIGSFIIYNLTSQEEKTFSIKLDTATRSTNPILTITDSKGNIVSKDSDINYYSYDSSQSPNQPNVYKFIIGKQDVKTTLTTIEQNYVLPFAKKNNGTSQSDYIMIKGEPVYDSKFLNITKGSNCLLNQQLTFFVNMETGKGPIIGQETYEGSGKTIQVPIYSGYVEIMVIYWPQMEIAGVHRVYFAGNYSTPQWSTHEPTEFIEYPGENEIKSWINSLPRE